MLFWFMLTRILKLDRFRYRHLSLGEIQLCQRVFANLIDYSQVKIMNHPYLPWQSINMLMAPEGYIHVRNRHYALDYSQQSLAYQALFIHEMTHVYQYQQGVHVLWHGALLQCAYFLSFRKYNPYAYQFKTQKNFWHYNIEQQGDIARDIFLGKIDNILLRDALH